jgi:hypothetical protein
VRGIGSIPMAVLEVLFAFAVLVSLKFCITDQGCNQTVNETTNERDEVVPMCRAQRVKRAVRRMWYAALETAWAVGASAVAGLSPLT